MDKIRLFLERGCWIAPLSLLLSLLAVITAQPGFLSISCGGKSNHTAKNNITWVTDANYIEVGETADIGDLTEEAYGSSLQTLRFFPKPLNKSCYQLPVTPDVPYLLRLWFALGNYTGFQKLPSFSFSIETVDMLYVESVATADESPLSYERILVSSGSVLYICLIRTSEPDDPFISAIELRTFQDGMYPQAKPGTILWPSSFNLGGNSVVRYPQDKFDRIWSSDLTINAQNLSSVRNVSSQEVISTNNTRDLPPAAVMQTAWVANNDDSLPVPLASPKGCRPLLLFYFAEIETLNMSESRSFYVAINDETQSEIITLVRNYSAIELTLLPNQVDKINIIKAPKSTRSPILNVLDCLCLYATDQATYSQDVYALHAIKRSFDIKEWVSDPCYVIQWRGIGCANSSSLIRISEIYLSGRNLTGSVPKDIAELTELVNLSLDNNHLMGSLPNFSNLTMLERLYLQNNNLSGTVEWLSELKNLKELNIENNNFSGVIPAQLLLNCSLKLNYSGNPSLGRGKRECTRQDSNNNKLVLILFYPGRSTEHSEVDWKRRLKIALDAAQGLEYLHVGSTPKIIHRDVKTANILLDSNMNGKLADFGLSRMAIDREAPHVTTAVKGTAGYLDPEYYNTQMLTEKSDVYSFGVVLLEIICGRPPIDLKLLEPERNIIQWVIPYLKEMDENDGKITEIIDKRLGGSYDNKSVTRVAKVAMRCVQDVRSLRPSVSEVVAEFKESLKYEEIGMEGGDLLVGATKRKGMEWNDNSSNISKVGR